MAGVKERVLLISESKGINKAVFFEGLGLSYANFKGVQKYSALSSDAMILILNKYDDVSPTWLLMGVGDMYKDSAGMERIPVIYHTPAADERSDLMVDALNKVINALEQTVRTQEKIILALEKQISFLERE
ncbi:hypothetical protein ACFX5U_19745 [Sphingobacterium sp. SG20118]|uniref:hypothetical protein n=1 Tax=Sphingobacterium TaxID=28453 RepID=UPI0004F6D61B|nr:MULTISPECIES: hypothetical protein [Sphingobacterium]AIM38915.1 hypothetical protein KO02_21075 [Sphingobacterium sp. ML3W]MDH5825095.1 hypothetical protein [Sphingobacterium faecium]